MLLKDAFHGAMVRKKKRRREPHPAAQSGELSISSVKLDGGNPLHVAGIVIIILAILVSMGILQPKKILILLRDTGTVFCASEIQGNV